MIHTLKFILATFIIIINFIFFSCNTPNKYPTVGGIEKVIIYLAYGMASQLITWPYYSYVFLVNGPQTRA